MASTAAAVAPKKKGKKGQEGGSGAGRTMPPLSPTFDPNSKD